MTVINNKPVEPIISKTEIGYTIIKQRFGSNTDPDLAKVGGWVRQSSQGAQLAVYSDIVYDRDNRIFTWSGLVHDTDHIVSLSYLDDFILGSSDLIRAQYKSEESLDLVHTNVHTRDPILITEIVNEVDVDAVANPFSNLVFTYTGEADSIRIQLRKTDSAIWDTVYEGKPSQGFKVSAAGGTYELRYVSIVGFSDGTIEEFPARVWPEEIVVESGLGVPVEVSGVTLASFKVAGSTASYDLRVAWVYPTDTANQNKKRNFTVTVLPNPTQNTDYANMDWSLAGEEIAIASPYVIKPFPYKTHYVVRIGVMGWGTGASEYVYRPVFISKDPDDSAILGVLVPSDSEAPTTSKIQIDDEYIRAYSVFNPNNPTENKLMFEISALTGNVIIGRAGGAYNNTNITTAPFVFDSQNNKLQISGRVINDQIESASYVLTWIDGDSPSLRTAGKSGYGSSAPGIWMGYTNSTTFAFDLGNATNFMRWDGENLTISGTVKIGNDGRTAGQAQKQVFIYKRSSTGTPSIPTGGTYAAPAPAGWSTTVPTGSDELYMSSRLFTTDAMPPQEPNWATPSLFMPGSTGTATTYTWIKYADTVTGTNLSDDPTGKDYIGIAVNKEFATESPNAEDYTWSRLTGTPGVPGTPGTDGQTYYTWIKYSQNANGVPMTDAPDANTQYIGISPNRDTATESTNAADYTWSKFKGDQGIPGVNNFKSTVFRRSATNPGTPSGGSYSSPIPTSGGWSDGIPSGEEVLWASTRIFAADNVSPPHQANWSAPVAMTNTSDLEIRYSTLVASPGDPTSNAANWSTSASAATVWMAQRTKTNGVWSAWNVTKIKGEAGAPGAPGEDGRVLSLTASTQTITFNSQDVMTPAGQSINFTVYRANITANTIWSAVDESGNVVAISGTNTSATLDGSALQSRKSISVTATAGGLSDTISVAKVRDGSDSIIAILSNESHGVAASSTGVVSSFAGAGGNMRVYRGTSEITNSCTFAVSSSSGATGQINASGAYFVEAMSADVGTLTLTATFGSTTISKIFTVTKVKAGLIGRRGAGQYSAVYTNPTLGSISAGMAAAAKAACPESTPVVGDIVTLRDSDPTKVPVSMVYNGPGDGSNASDWALFALTIDGNLLVKGTVGADKINVNEVFAKTVDVAGTLTVGSNGNVTTISGTTGGIEAYVNNNKVFAATGGVGFLQGMYLQPKSVHMDSLGQSVIDYIDNKASGGVALEYGGSASGGSTLLSSGTYGMTPPINCSDTVPISLNFNYGGRSRIIYSQTEPFAPSVQIQFKRGGVNIGSLQTFPGTVERGDTNEWFLNIPPINYSTSGIMVPPGETTFSAVISLMWPHAQSINSLGSFNIGVYQEPSGEGITNMNINDLIDVVINSATNGQVLTFENGNWVNKAPTGGGTVLDGRITATADGVRVYRQSGTAASYVQFKDSGDGIAGGNGWVDINVASSQIVSVSGSGMGVHGGFTVAGSGDQIATFNRVGAGWSYIGFSQNETRKGYIGVDNTGKSVWGSDTGALDIVGTLTNGGYPVLNSSNYNTYAPTKTGTGASGSWGINVTGNAATATKLAAAVSITASGDATFGWNFDGSTSVEDANVTLKTMSGLVANTYGSAALIPMVSVDTKGRVTAISSITPSGTWGINTTGSARSLSGSGATVTMLSTGCLVKGSGSTGAAYLGSSSSWIGGGPAYVDVYAGGNAMAYMSSSGISLYYATNVSGTITATDCIATSDIRVKTDLKRIDNPIERLKKLNGGYTFNRTDMDNIRHAGVIANYVKEALPEAIFVGKDSDLLTVSHSGMLGLLVEVCTEQQKRIEALEKRLNGNG